jgi:hypothetical protein
MPRTAKRFVFCLSSEGYAASLERSKVYLNLPDPAIERLGLLRVIDDSGTDYLFPETRFVTIDLPRSARKSVLHAV